jgi:hypothetical protein
MTRLELAQRFARESGISSSGPSSTTNQTGEYLWLVEQIDTAYNDILVMHNGRWRFLRTDYSQALSSGTSEYSAPSDLGEWIVDDWRCYLTATGTSDEQEIFWYPYEDFKRSYLFGNQRTQSGRPNSFAIKPDDSVVFWQVPDDSYTALGEYFKIAEAMDEDADEPVFPSRFHMMIVWRALIYYGGSYVEPDKYTFAQNEYKRLKRQLENAELAAWKWVAPLC